MSEPVSEPLGEHVSEKPTLLERHFRKKLDRIYAKSADRQRRAPAALAKAEAKRQRRAEKRKAR